MTRGRSPARSHAADPLAADPRPAVVSCVLVGPDDRRDPTCAAMEHAPLPAAPASPGVPLLGFLAGASMIRGDVGTRARGLQQLGDMRTAGRRRTRSGPAARR
jgi:hypothetical protein